MLLSAVCVSAAGRFIHRYLSSGSGPALAPVTVTAVQKLSATVKDFEVVPADKSAFSFKAGQWVDVHFPKQDGDGFEKFIGGFSLASAPSEYQQTGKFKLAVKLSDHKPAQWMHDVCKAGSLLHMQVGGNVFLHEDITRAVFVAGGIGISPIRGMVMEFIQRAGAKGALLYSAKPGELVFKEELASLDSEAMTSVISETGSVESRLSVEDVLQQYKALAKDGLPTKVYLCGPPSMIDEFSEKLAQSGLPDGTVCYERWW